MTVEYIGKCCWIKRLKRYINDCKGIENLHEYSRARYDIDENMIREQLIEVIKTLDKKKIDEFLNTMPDGVIVDKFK